MTSITKTTTPAHTKYSIKKKDVKSILFPTYPPAFHPHSFVVPGRKSNTRPLLTKNDNSGRHKICKRKKMLNRFYFPPTLPHSTIFWTVEPTQPPSPKTQLRPTYSIKKMLNRFYFPPTLPHSTHILLWRRTGEPTHDLHHQERQLRPTKIFNRKKMLNRFYFPPTLPHSTHILLWCRAGKPTHDLHHQERQLRPSQKYSKKKMLNRFYFPPTLPHSTHILLWRRTGEPTHDLHHQKRQSGPQKYSIEKRC
ncbi:hypothetical protein TNCV_456641 [Trichonephila clavipes]|uniref:Uncharacterized protein n=1 Tax=Trichonephila clavipes TaxID=2585209 RepID=A0A8X6RWL8_TRICX|nr:hypothetical protein TNCV_456641 [Trichonephila clavipes]